MKKFVLVSIILAFNIYLFAELKGAFIDWQLITDKHPLAQKKLAELERWAKPYKDKIKDYEKKLQAMDKDYQENIMASDKIKKDKETAMNKLYFEYQNYIKDFREQLQMKENEVIPEDIQLKISQDLLNIIKKICADKAFNVIYDRTKSGAVYVDDDLDITTQVIDELNKIKIDEGSKISPKFDDQSKPKSKKDK